MCTWQQCQDFCETILFPFHCSPAISSRYFKYLFIFSFFPPFFTNLGCYWYCTVKGGVSVFATTALFVLWVNQLHCPSRELNLVFQNCWFGITMGVGLNMTRLLCLQFFQKLPFQKFAVSEPEHNSPSKHDSACEEAQRKWTQKISARSGHNHHTKVKFTQCDLWYYVKSLFTDVNYFTSSMNPSPPHHPKQVQVHLYRICTINCSPLKLSPGMTT